MVVLVHNHLCQSYITAASVSITLQGALLRFFQIPDLLTVLSTPTRACKIGPIVRPLLAIITEPLHNRAGERRKVAPYLPWPIPWLDVQGLLEHCWGISEPLLATVGHAAGPLQVMLTAVAGGVVCWLLGFQL